MAVKSPIMPNPTSGVLSSLLGSGSEGWKALVEKRMEGGAYSCASSYGPSYQPSCMSFIIFVCFLKVFTE